MAQAKGLALYQYTGCPYCRRVLDAARRMGLELEVCDTLLDGERARELLEATGRRTVPVLRIEEPEGEVRWLAESADIIDYLERRFA